MKKNEIVSVLYELYKITGFRMSLHDTDFGEIAAYPPEKLPLCRLIHSFDGELGKCEMGDSVAFKTVNQTKETLIYKCRYGLTEAVSPLYNFGILTGYLMMGQIGDENTDFAQIERELLALGIDSAALRKALLETKKVPSDMTRSYVRIMTICAQYLTLSNAMPGVKPTVAEAAKKYICENIDKKITLKDICENVGCSKTTLVASFKKEFGKTVNTAITEAKLEEAVKLFSSHNMSINEIAIATGFLDQSYFSKVFLSKYGISPSEYRKKKAEDRK